MKRIISIIAAAAAALSLCVFASADVIWEPEDDFFTRHSEQCEYESFTCYANGESGYVEVYSKPGDGRPKQVIPNGGLYSVSWTYENRWALIEYDSQTLQNAYDAETGWVKLSQLEKKYDSDDFISDHGDKLSDEIVTLKPEEIGESFAVWSYPGSGEVMYENMPPYSELSLGSIYTDGEGRRWGYVGYYYGRLNGWVCIDEPSSTDIPAGPERVVQELIPAAGESELRNVPVSFGNETLLAACAAGIAAVAAGMIVWLVRRKKV